MSNLMILGASTLQIPLIQQARKSGYQTVVVAPSPQEPGFEFASHTVYADVRDEETVLEHARAHQVVGITTDQTDLPVRTAAYVAEQLGLPGIGYETACLFTDKYLMREKCRELGIPTLNYQKAGNLKEAMAFLETVPDGVILKPVDNQGSKGVARVDSKEELEVKFEQAMRYSKEQAVLIEQFVTGQEFVVEGLAYNYDFQNLICGDTYYFDVPDIFAANTRIFPSQAAGELIERIEALNKKIISGFRLKQGVTHSEFIMSGDEIYLIETAARGGGVFISSDLISLSTGLNTEAFLIGIATGTQDQVPALAETGLVCCYLAFLLPVGEIVTLGGLEEVKALPFTHRHNLDALRLGLMTRPYTDKTARSFIVVSGNDHEQLAEHVKSIKQTLNVKVETREGLKGPIWT